MKRTGQTWIAGLLVALALAPAGVARAGEGFGDRDRDGDRSGTLQRIDHFVVIYQENHSFDNLYGGWERVRGLRRADPSHTRQVTQAGQPYECLRQDDVNLASPPLAATCHETTGTVFDSAFTNSPFLIDAYIAATDRTCPAPGVFAPNGVLKNAPGALPGGCTRDIVHRFYQEQYQINGGRMNRYVTGSDAVGLVMGHYDTRALPIYRYLHREDHPRYAIADNFFQAAFGGSFLNHQWLVAAASPIFAGALQDGSSGDLHSIVDADGFPNASYPLYVPATPVKDAQLTVKCPAPVPGLACGDYAVNTTQPWFQPYAPGTAAPRRLMPLTTLTIGDRLIAAGVDWAWYSGGWSNANGDVGGPGWTNGPSSCTDPETIAGAVFPNCANSLFQFHHQPFNYFAAFDPTTPAGLANRQAHLRDEEEFLQLARTSTSRTCHLKPVSFVKPIGAENEHPGYASEGTGSQHLVDLIDAIQHSACARNTMIIVTYDEFGGQWDHVPPPGQGNHHGPHDVWGPGTRVPALIVAPFLRDEFVVDHTSYDTTSILATLEKRYGLPPLGSRDAAVRDLSNVFDARD